MHVLHASVVTGPPFCWKGLEEQLAASKEDIKHSRSECIRVKSLLEENRRREHARPYAQAAGMSWKCAYSMLRITSL